MSIIEKMTKIVNEGDTAGAEELIHDDYQFLMHSSGKSLTKKDVVGWVGMKDVKKSNLSCLLYTSPSPRDLSTSRMPSSA